MRRVDKIGVKESNRDVTFTLLRHLAPEVECPPLRAGRLAVIASK
jgi:hypothetical protein